MSGVPDRVAIVMLSAIGDVVHVMPVVHSLRAANPGVHITWIIQPGPHGLVAGHPAVDEFIVFDRKRGWRAFRDLQIAMRGRRFDLVLTLQSYFKAGVITALLPAPRKIGFDRARARDVSWIFSTERIPARGTRNMQDQYLEFPEHLGIPVVRRWELGPTAEERARYAGVLRPFDGPTVAMVVGTSRAGKEWPAERYAELADRLHAELGARTLLVGGLSDREREVASLLKSRAQHPPIDLLEWDLRKLAYLLSRADVLVSPDTGPLHVGVALGTPSVALMGFTNPKRVGPYRFGELTIDAYGDEGEDYPAAAGHREGRMERIAVERVVERVRLALERYPRERPDGQSSP